MTGSLEASSFPTPDARAGAREPSALDIALRLRAGLPALAAELDMAGFARWIAGVDRLCGAYVCEVLSGLGLPGESGATFSAESFAAAAGVVPRHRRLLERLLEILAEDGWLDRAGEGWRIRGDLPATGSPALLAGLAEGHPALREQLPLLARCAQALPRVLRGELDPLKVLFPGGDVRALELIYRSGPAARLLNTLVRQAVCGFLEERPAGGQRILEVGAGTGGTSAHLLPALPAEGVDYVFSDLSPLFLSRAARAFRDFGFVSFRRLDLEADPAGQGFAGERFDVVIAANVLHAVTDLRRGLRHVRALLLPGGLLVVCEGILRHRRSDLIFGMLGGWWHFADSDLRPSYPLISAERWRALLEQEGFEAAVVPDDADACEGLARQAIFVARLRP